jgi:hypothetical protein
VMTLLEVIDAPIHISDLFDLTVSLKLINFSFQIVLIFVPEMSASFTSYTIWIIYTALVWILYPLHFNLLPLIQKLWTFFIKPWFMMLPFLQNYLVEVLIFSLMFSKALFISLLPFKISKAAKLFEILIWYCFLTPAHLAAWDINLCTSNICAAGLLTAYLFPPFCNHQMVISITVSPLEIPYISYTRMPSPISQYVTNLVVSLPVRRGSGIFMNVAVLEHRAFNN